MKRNYSAMELEELLRPSQFDWADESEELEELEEVERRSEWSLEEGELEETMASFYDLERQPSKSYGEPTSEGVEEWSDFDESMPQESEPDYEELKRARMQEDVNQEFAFRQGWMEVAGASIHHFNWLGSPRYEYSSTPAAISLLFLCAAPKIPEPGDEWRLDAIMCRAMQYVDPVVLYPENGREGFRLKGCALVQWATGRVFKFYSPHGKWQTDPDDIADGTHVDNGNVNTYMGSTLQFGNGYVRDYTIRSRAQWGDEHQRLFQHKFLARSQTRLPTPHKPSLLRHCVFPDDLEDSAEAKPSMRPEIHRPASRIPRMRRAFSESTLAGLQRKSSAHGLESGFDAMIEDTSEDSDNDSDDSNDEYLDIGEIVQLSYREFKEAERRGTDIVERAAIAPSLKTIPEDEEAIFESERDESIMDQAQDDLADQMVEQEQGDQNTVIVEENRDIKNDLAVEQAQDGQDDHSNQNQKCLQKDQLGDYAQHNLNDDTIKTVVEEQNGKNGQNDETVGQPEDENDQKIETVEPNTTDEDQRGQIDQLKSIETTEQNKKSYQGISTGTHITSGSDVVHYISANVHTVVSEPSSPPTDQKNEKWKRRISHIYQKSCSVLRSKDARFLPKFNSSDSFESTPSPTSSCDSDRQQIFLFHTEIPRDGDERPHKTSSTKKLAIKAKRVLSRSSSENDTTRPKKQRRITFSDLFYEGIWAFESSFHADGMI